MVLSPSQTLIYPFGFGLRFKGYNPRGENQEYGQV